MILLPVKEIFNDLFSNPIRVLLASIGIAFGTSSLVIAVIIGTSCSKNLEKIINELGTNLIFVKSKPIYKRLMSGIKSRKGFTRQDIETIKQYCTGVQMVIPKLDNRVYFISYHGKTELAWIEGTVSDAFRLHGMEMIKGRPFSHMDLREHKDICIIGYDIWKYLFDGKNAIGKFIIIGKHSYRIVGILKYRAQILYYDYNTRILIPLTTMQDNFSNSKNIEKIEIYTNSSKNIGIVANCIELILNHLHKVKDFVVYTPEQLLNVEKKVSCIFKGLFITLSAISLLIGGIAIMNAMIANITERTKEIGIRRALGASRRDIFSYVVIQCLLIGFIGSIVGSILGIGLSVIAHHFLIKYLPAGFYWKIFFPWKSYLGAALFCTAIAGIFGLYPAIRASHIDPSEAMRRG